MLIMSSDIDCIFRLKIKNKKKTFSSIKLKKTSHPHVLSPSYKLKLFCAGQLLSFCVCSSGSEISEHIGWKIIYATACPHILDNINTIKVFASKHLVFFVFFSFAYKK